MERIGIIFGGKSDEHEISLMSAGSVIGNISREGREIVKIGITRGGKWLLYEGPDGDIATGEWEKKALADYEADPEKYGVTIFGTGGVSLSDIIDFALPIVHGPYCEDGRLQGFLETVGVPYAGCHVLPSAIAMDKLAAKELFKNAGIPICKHEAVFAEEIADEKGMADVIERINRNLGRKVFVKPANLGSSVGINKAEDDASLREALIVAAKHDRRVIVEEAVNCREIETGVIGNYDPKASVTGEIVAQSDVFYDYSSKYVDDGKPKMQIPADLPAEVSEKIREYAVKAYKAIDGSGYARCDFFVDRETGEIYINEINTIPGFTQFSMFPLLWEAAGLPYADMIEKVIEYGYERHNAEDRWKADR